MQLLFGTDGRGDIELHVPHLRPDHDAGPPAEVIDQLLGFDAPPHWTALAVSAGATVRSLVDGSAPPIPARLTFAIDRRGRLVSHLSGSHQLPAEALHSNDSDQVEGFMIALVRRVLGLPNRDVAGGVFDWWNARWLMAILELVDDPGGTGTARRPAELTVAELLVLHPGIGRHIDPDEEPADLVDDAREAALATTWAELREAASGGVQGWITAELAQWCDAEVFAGLGLARLAVGTVEHHRTHGPPQRTGARRNRRASSPEVAGTNFSGIVNPPAVALGSPGGSPG